MKYRLLVVASLALALAVFVTQALLPPASRSAFYFVAVMLAKATALTGGLVAASSFKRGDYLRRAWLLFAVSYVFILGKDLLFGGAVYLGAQNVFYGRSVHLPGIDPASPFAADMRALFILVGNALGVANVYMLARAWRVADLELPGSARLQRAIVIGSVAVSIAVAGWGAVIDLGDFIHSHATPALGAVASDLGDVVSFCLIAPVFMTAWALRGGKLVWPWALFTASRLAWILFDVVASAGSLLHVSPALLRGMTETCRALACVLVLAAGIAQRWAVAKRAR